MLWGARALLDMPQETTAGPIFRLRRQRFTNGLNDEAELSPWRTKEATPYHLFPHHLKELPA
jgi:hypothetical protein